MNEYMDLFTDALTRDGVIRNTNGETLEAYIPTRFSENHAPSLLELSNGDILAVWFAGATEEGRGDIKIVMSRLNHGSLQWTESVFLSDDYTMSEQNPVFFQAADGTVYLLHTAQQGMMVSREEFRKENESNPFTRQETAIIRWRKSQDLGCTWGPVEVFSDNPGSFCRAPIVTLSNGDWIFPMWYSLSDGQTMYGSDHSVVRISSDLGVTWTEHAIPKSQGRVHPFILELENGKLRVFFRSRSADHIYVSDSSDYGRNWSAPRPTLLPNNNASICAIKLQSGRIAIVFNRFRGNEDPDRTVWPDERYPVTVALSEDGGETWPYIKDIEFGDGFCGYKNRQLNRRFEYPWLMQTRDGLLHAAFAHRSRQGIKHMVFSEEWIMGSNLTRKIQGPV